MLIRLRSTGEVIADTVFLALHDNVSFPSPLRQQDISNFDADVVLEGNSPQPGKFQSVEADGVEQVNDQWFTKFKIVNWTQDQIDAYSDLQKYQIRTDRNKRLVASDWTQVADAPIDKAAWATYRQALRDIPSQAGFPWDVQWPVEP